MYMHMHMQNTATLRNRKMKTNRLTRIAAGAALILSGTWAQAAEPIEFENGMKIDWGLTLGYTLAMRAEKPDASIASDPTPGSFNLNYNDGNNNFDRGDLVNNRLSGLLTAKVSKGNTGFVFSGSAFYDDVYHRTNANRPEKYAQPFNAFIGTPNPLNEFSPDAKKFHGGYGRVLDAYFYTNFKVGKQGRVNLKLGRHVVSWGESLFFPNVSMAQGPADGGKANIPGTQIKDILLPEDQISLSYSVNPKVTLLANYQYGWHPTVVDAPGSYLSRSDQVGPGAHCIGYWNHEQKICQYRKYSETGARNDSTGGERARDTTPPENGQWGMGMRYRYSLDTEFGLYYVRYHERVGLPLIAYDISGPNFYSVYYQPKIDLLGASFTTSLGDFVVAGEATYRKGAPVLLGGKRARIGANQVWNPGTGDVVQLNLNTFANFGRTRIAPQTIFLGELSWMHVAKVNPMYFPRVGSSQPLYGDQLDLWTKNSLAFQGLLMLMYPGIYDSWDLTVPIGYAQQFTGRNAFSNLGSKGDKRLALGAVFNKGSWEVRGDYVMFLGKPSTDPLGGRVLVDRDFVSVGAKYTF